MKVTPEQRRSWAELTAQSPFNRWLADQVRGPDGLFDLEKLHSVASRYGIDKRSEYELLNSGQQRMNIGNLLRARVPEASYSSYAGAETRRPRIFGTRFWGFDPVSSPFAGFTYEGSRASLIARSQPGDLIAIVGTMEEPTAVADRGKLLGLLEFLATPMQATDLIPPGQELPEHLFENGRFKWPYAVPITRAWRFTSPKLIRQVIDRQLTMAATTGVDPLSEDEVDAVLNLDFEEVELPLSRAQLRNIRLGESSKPKLSSDGAGQPGPPPSEWSAITSRADGPTATYLMRFGHQDVWKVGISQNVKDRRQSLNFAIPTEILDGQEWQVFLTKIWPSGATAYQMEQALLDRLKIYATRNERVATSRDVVERAWQDFLLGRF